MQEHQELREKIMQAIMVRFAAYCTKDQCRQQAEAIADEVMDTVAGRFRSVTEVEQIVEAVQAGHNVQIAYWDPEEDAGPDGLPDPMIVRPCWGNPDQGGKSENV